MYNQLNQREKNACIRYFLCYLYINEELFEREISSFS